MYVYLDCGDEGPTEIYTVGFFDPKGVWVPETDWATADEAAKRVHYLNGGNLHNFEELRLRDDRRTNDEHLYKTSQNYSEREFNDWILATAKENLPHFPGKTLLEVAKFIKKIQPPITGSTK